MSETITVCENVCRDFSWVNPFLGFVANLVPVAGLIWAINAYYRKRKDDRDEEDRRERRKAYRDFLAQVEIATLGTQGHEAPEDPALRRLWAIFSEIEMIDNTELVTLAAEVVNAVNDCRFDSLRQRTCSDGQERGSYDKMLFERRVLVDALKKEFGK